MDQITSCIIRKGLWVMMDPQIIITQLFSSSVVVQSFSVNCFGLIAHVTLSFRFTLPALINLVSRCYLHCSQWKSFNEHQIAKKKHKQLAGEHSSIYSWRERESYFPKEEPQQSWNEREYWTWTGFCDKTETHFKMIPDTWSASQCIC